jgi:hypothetical protein
MVRFSINSTTRNALCSKSHRQACGRGGAATTPHEFVAGGNDWGDCYFQAVGKGTLEDWNSELHRRLADAVTNIAARSAKLEAARHA